MGGSTSAGGADGKKVFDGLISDDRRFATSDKGSTASTVVVVHFVLVCWNQGMILNTYVRKKGLWVVAAKRRKVNEGD
jgi:hypothetical protein